MKAYRLHMTVDNGVSIGYAYFTSKSAAERRRLEHMRDHPNEDATPNGIDELDFALTKVGVVNLLNRTADHPDNG